jgi:hypothetical protein
MMRIFSRREISTHSSEHLERYLVFYLQTDTSVCGYLSYDLVKDFLEIKTPEEIYEMFSESVVADIKRKLPDLDNEEVSFVLWSIKKFIGEIRASTISNSD